jgi:hypothetical protein
LQQRTGALSRQLLNDLTCERRIATFQSQACALFDQRSGEHTIVLRPRERAVAFRQGMRCQPFFRNLAAETFSLTELDAGDKALATRRIGGVGITISLDKQRPLRAPRQAVEPGATQNPANGQWGIRSEKLRGLPVGRSGGRIVAIEALSDACGL